MAGDVLEVRIGAQELGIDVETRLGNDAVHRPSDTYTILVYQASDWANRELPFSVSNMLFSFSSCGDELRPDRERDKTC